MQPLSITILSISAIALLFQGAFTEPVLLALLLAVPVSLIASQIGVTLFKRLSDAQFQTLLIALILLSGIGIILRELFLP